MECSELTGVSVHGDLSLLAPPSSKAPPPKLLKMRNATHPMNPIMPNFTFVKKKKKKNKGAKKVFSYMINSGFNLD